jgi:hypothetical protein
MPALIRVLKLYLEETRHTILLESELLARRIVSNYIKRYVQTF